MGFVQTGVLSTCKYLLTCCGRTTEGWTYSSSSDFVCKSRDLNLVLLTEVVWIQSKFLGKYFNVSKIINDNKFNNVEQPSICIKLLVVSEFHYFQLISELGGKNLLMATSNFLNDGTYAKVLKFSHLFQSKQSFQMRFYVNQYLMRVSTPTSFEA